MLKFILVSVFIGSLEIINAADQDRFVNGDLPFGFWFGGHGQVRRQGRASPPIKQRLDVAPTAEPKSVAPRFSDKEFTIGEEVLQFLLEKMHQRRQSIMKKERQNFGVSNYSWIRKRSPEIAQTLHQYNKNRGLYGIGLETGLHGIGLETGLHRIGLSNGIQGPPLDNQAHSQEEDNSLELVHDLQGQDHHKDDLGDLTWSRGTPWQLHHNIVIPTLQDMQDFYRSQDMKESEEQNIDLSSLQKVDPSKLQRPHLPKYFGISK